jgi:hypothetical protein
MNAPHFERIRRVRAATVFKRRVARTLDSWAIQNRETPRRWATEFSQRELADRASL